MCASAHCLLAVAEVHSPVDTGIKFARLLPSQSEAVWGRDVAAAESLWKFPSLRLWDLYENHFLKSSIFIVEIEG